MENKLKIAVLLLIMAVCPVLTTQAQMNIEDMDEDDWINQQDTTMFSRKNRTLEKENKYDAMQYILNDTYTPTDQEFNKAWYDHIYVGASIGVQRFLKEDYVPELTTMPTLGFFIGKHLTPIHSVRLSAVGAAGYLKGHGKRYFLVNAKADYLYSITNKLRGYNSTRPLEISIMGGIGGGAFNMQERKHAYNVEAHAGMQFKIYTGPFGSITLEPYVGIATDNIDYSGSKNWRGFDWYYGVSAGYMFYTMDNLSKQARMKLLQHRLNGDRLIDRYSLESWRTPWFVQVSMGGVKGTVLQEGNANGRGNITTLSIGRWMSPVIGMRLGAGSRMTNWYKREDPFNMTGQVLTTNYGSHLLYGKLEALFNPLGFMRNFSWEAPYGGYLFGGVEVGQMHKYSVDNKKFSKTALGYTIGANLWYRLSKDLQVFVEPHLSSDYYTMGVNGGAEERRTDNNYGIDLGLTMLIRTPRYREPEEYDKVQNYNYRDIRGFSFGGGIGASTLQRRQANYGHDGFNFSGMGYLEYRFNHLHGVRLAVEGMYLNANIPHENTIILKSRSLFAIGSLNYQVNLTNLLSGRFADRTFGLEAYLGPAFGTVIAGKKSDKNSFIGADLGFKLSLPVTSGVDVILQPTFYLLGNGTLPTANTIGFGDKVHFYQDVTAGIQIDTRYFAERIGKSLAKQKVNRKTKWEQAQEQAIKDYQQKMIEKKNKRHAK